MLSCSSCSARNAAGGESRRRSRRQVTTLTLWVSMAFCWTLTCTVTRTNWSRAASGTTHHYCHWRDITFSIIEVIIMYINTANTKVRVLIVCFHQNPLFWWSLFHHQIWRNVAFHHLLTCEWVPPQWESKHLIIHIICPAIHILRRQKMKKNILKMFITKIWVYYP